MISNNPRFTRNIFTNRETSKATLKKMDLEHQIKKRKEILQIRKIKITELYSKEKENYDFELASSNNNTYINGNSFYREEANRIKSSKLINNNYRSEFMKKGNNENDLRDYSNDFNYHNKNEPKNSAYEERKDLDEINNYYGVRNERKLNSYDGMNKIQRRREFGSNKNNLNFIENSILNLPKIKSAIDEDKLIINKELDNAIFKYNENLDKLKLEDFLSKKKYQDELIYKINNKLNRYNKELDEKVYQEKLANEWYEEYKKRMQQIAFSSNDNYNNSLNYNNINDYHD